MNDKHDLLPTLALHGYVWQASSFANGGVGTHSSGWKIAVDLDTGEWTHYRTRGDKATDGKYRAALAAHLRSATYAALGSAKTHGQTLSALQACVRMTPRRRG